MNLRDLIRTYFLIAVLALLAFFLLCWTPAARGEEPTPTPGTPEEWSEWLDGQEDVETIWTGEYNPMLPGRPKPWKYVKQSLEAGVAVELEIGYTPYVRDGVLVGHWYQGPVCVVLTEPIIQTASLSWYLPVMPLSQVRPRPTPEHAGPPVARPTPVLPDQARRPPRIGDQTPEGRVVDVIVSREFVPGAEMREARRAPAVRLLDRPITGEVKIEQRPWHPSYAVIEGPVWYKAVTE